MNLELFLTIVAALMVARLLQPLVDRASGAIFGGRTSARLPSQTASASGATGRRS